MGACDSKAHDLKAGHLVSIPYTQQRTPRHATPHNALNSDDDVKAFRGPHADRATCVCAAPNLPGALYSCDDDGRVALVHWRQRAVLDAYDGHRKSATRVCAARDGGGGVYSAARDGTIKWWRRGEASPLLSLQAHSLTVSAIAAADGVSTNASLFSGSRDTHVKLWDASTGQCVSSACIARNLVTSATWVPGGSPLVWQASEDLHLRLWDTRAMRTPAADLAGYKYFPLAIAASEHRCVTGSNGFEGAGCELRLYDARTHKQEALLEGHQHAVTGVALMGAGGGEHAIASASRDGELRLWGRDGGGGGAGEWASLGSASLGAEVTSLATACDDEPEARLYVADATGALRAYATNLADGELRLLRTAEPEPGGV